MEGIVRQDKTPIEELRDRCENEMLKKAVDTYIQSRQEGKDAVVAKLTALFASTLEERLNATENED